MKILIFINLKGTHMRMDKYVRVPQQKRSIEKKQRIIRVAYQLFNEHGYYATNTSMIAKHANLSVCSIYSYFQNKTDIILACLQENSKQINQQIREQISNVSINNDIFSTIQKIYQIFINTHNFPKQYYNDIMSLKYTNIDIRIFFEKERLFFTQITLEQLKKTGIVLKYEKEQLFLIYSLLEDLENEIISNRDTNMNFEILIDECVHIISDMLQGEMH